MEEEKRSISIVKVLKQLGDYIKQNVENEFKEMKLTGTQGMLIGTLAHDGEMKISDLSDKIGLSNSTVSGIIDRLEKPGYVERIRSKEDRRVVHVRVTPEFRKKVKEHFDKIDTKIDTIMNKATPEEVNKVFEGLNILKKLMDKE